MIFGVGGLASPQSFLGASCGRFEGLVFGPGCEKHTAFAAV